MLTKYSIIQIKRSQNQNLSHPSPLIGHHICRYDWAECCLLLLGWLHYCFRSHYIYRYQYKRDRELLPVNLTKTFWSKNLIPHFFIAITTYKFFVQFQRKVGNSMGFFCLKQILIKTISRRFTCVYRGVRNVSFSENFAYELNEWSVKALAIRQDWYFSRFHYESRNMFVNTGKGKYFIFQIILPKDVDMGRKFQGTLKSSTFFHFKAYLHLRDILYKLPKY